MPNYKRSDFWKTITKYIQRDIEKRLIYPKEKPVAYFNWFDIFFKNRRYGDQKVFLFWLIDVFEEIYGKCYTYEALKKNYQRFRAASPNKRNRMLQSTKKKKLDIFKFFPTVDPLTINYSNNFPLLSFEKKADEVWRRIMIETKHYDLTRKGLFARGTWTEGKFTVLAGSQLSKSVTNSCKTFYRIIRIRKYLIESGRLKDKGDVYEFLYDYDFNSPSLAASVLSGVNLNGQKYWKDFYGQTIGKFRKKEELKTKRGPGRPRKSS